MTDEPPGIPTVSDPEDAPLVHERRIAAAPETVFDFFVEPNLVVRWMGSRAELDPRPGGIFRLHYPQGVARGEYVTVDRPRRVVFSWGWEDPDDTTQPGQSTVEVTLEPDGAGTRLVLVHSGLVGEARRTHAEGWEYFLGRLVEAVKAEGGAS
jgi:uncharacterized protein YndB with AHSA1/START domain